ncbi:MAG: hypothetical protein AAF543_06555 [Pseudomonadota bacterium]
MSSDNAAMEAALLEIAKDLLQASDDLASSDPAASAKLAHEAYEIGRDLGIVRNHLDDDTSLSAALNGSSPQNEVMSIEPAEEPEDRPAYRHRHSEDDSDADLLRILDRQKAMLPKPVELSPVRTPSRNARTMTFESAPARRSGWFGWMRPREWRHAG